MFGKSNGNMGRGSPGRGRKRSDGSLGRNQKQQNRPEAMGPAGQCVCPKCGNTIMHRQGTPCQEELCPACGSKMLREGGYHHHLLKEKRNQGEEKK